MPCLDAANGAIYLYILSYLQTTILLTCLLALHDMYNYYYIVSHEILFKCPKLLAENMVTHTDNDNMEIYFWLEIRYSFNRLHYS